MDNRINLPSLFESARRSIHLPVAMVSMQVFWLSAIWYTGATSNSNKLIILILYTAISGTIIGCLSSRSIEQVKLITLNFAYDDKRQIVVLCVFATAVGAVYAFYQNVSTLAPEKMVLSASRVVAEDGFDSLFSRHGEITWLRQHPPLVLMLFGVTMRFFGEEMVVPRLVSLAFGLGSILVTYRLGKELYDSEIGLLASIFFVSSPYFFRLSAAVSNDIQVTFFFVSTLLVTFRLKQTPTFKLAVLGGALLGAGILTKYTMILIYPLLGYLFVVYRSNTKFRTQVLVLAAVSGVISASWIAFAHHIGMFAVQWDIMANFAGSYSKTTWAKLLLLEVLFTRFPSALGVYTLPALFLGGIGLFRRIKDPANRFVLVWIATIMLVFSLTVPDSRYCMLAFPALAMTMAHGLKTVPQVKVVLLLLLNCGGALYLFSDWKRSSYMFIGDVIHSIPG